MSGDTTIINGETAEIIATMTPDEARTLTDRIGTAIGVTWELVVEAYQGRAWAALGYTTWDAYTVAEFGKYRLRLPSEERQETVASLREAGLSTRAIAAAVGVHRRTVERDLDNAGGAFAPPDDRSSVDPASSSAVRPDGEQETDLEAPAASGSAPSNITGTDGKQYPAKPKDKPKPRRSALTDAAYTAGWDLRRSVEKVARIVGDDRFPANRDQVATALRSHLTNAIEVCHDLLDGFDTSPTED